MILDALKYLIDKGKELARVQRIAADKDSNGVYIRRDEHDTALAPMTIRVSTSKKGEVRAIVLTPVDPELRKKTARNALMDDLRAKMPSSTVLAGHLGRVTLP